MLKLKYLFDNKDLAMMILGNWEYDPSSIDMLKYYRISSNAIYPFKNEGKVRFLRFAPCDEKDKNNIIAELEFITYEGGICIGFVAIERASEDLYYMEKLAVLPEYRHKGIVTKLIDCVVDRVNKSGGKKVSIGIINESKKLKRLVYQEWFRRNEN